MSDKIIDLDLIDNDDENMFDNLMSTVEKLNLMGANKNTSNDLEVIVLSIERKMQDLSDENNKSAKTVYASVKNVLFEYTKILTNDSSFETIGLAANALSCINNTMRTGSDLKLIEEVAAKLSIKNNLKGNVSSLENIKKAAFIGVASVDYNQKNIDELFHPSNDLVWDIEMKIESQEFDDHKALEFLYRFVEILSTIEGVQIKIQDIKKGSIWAWLKAYFKSDKSKNDAAEVLESARKFASGKLEKEYEEKEKLKVEREKIDIERQILQQELNSSNDLDSLYLAALKVKHLEEDLKRKQLENARLSIELLKDSRETFAELLADGFVSQSDFKILINQIPFLEKVNGKLTIGETSIIKKGEQK